MLIKLFRRTYIFKVWFPANRRIKWLPSITLGFVGPVQRGEK